MVPFYEKSAKTHYAMNVNLKKSNVKGFLKNKLKSLLTNHFESYFKPYLFSTESYLTTITTYIHMSMEKFMPFLKKFFMLQIKDPQTQLL
jgi:hypothetical protein